MRKRDLAILMLSGFAIFFTLQHEGEFVFKEAWFHLYDSRRVNEGFSEARVLAEITLSPDKIRVASGRPAVAMATSVIDSNYKDGTPQKKVLVVVTSGWFVLCFDHNLQKLWETNLQEDFPHNAHHREIAISISDYTLKHGDTGLVIIGGQIEMQPYASEDYGTINLHHFSVYAFAGKTGVLRWSKKTDDVEAHTSDASQLIPQHNYKLDMHALNSRHRGEENTEETSL